MRSSPTPLRSSDRDEISVLRAYSRSKRFHEANTKRDLHTRLLRHIILPLPPVHQRLHLCAVAIHPSPSLPSPPPLPLVPPGAKFTMRPPARFALVYSRTKRREMSRAFRIIVARAGPGELLRRSIRGYKIIHRDQIGELAFTARRPATTDPSPCSPARLTAKHSPPSIIILLIFFTSFFIRCGHDSRFVKGFYETDNNHNNNPLLGLFPHKYRNLCRCSFF